MVLPSAPVQRGCAENPSKAFPKPFRAPALSCCCEGLSPSSVRWLRPMAKGCSEASWWPLGSSWPETGGMFQGWGLLGTSPLALSLGGVSLPSHKVGVGFTLRGSSWVSISLGLSL